ncbi:hypothetical protein [Haloquadratum walsbyi]|jgi:hypothetical protein|nr:hypothetical protein [Haloquadratum walsbyi]
MSGDSDNPPIPPRKNIKKGTYALGTWSGGSTLYELEHPPLIDNPTWKQKGHFEHTNPKTESIFFPDSTTVSQSDDGGPLPIHEKQLTSEGELVATWVYAKEFKSLENLSDTDAESNQKDDQNHKSKSDRRSLGGIEQDTVHHRTLYLLNQLSSGEEDKIPVMDIVEESPDKTGSITAQIKDLWKRKLVERKTVDGKFVYWMSGYGYEELDELSKPSLDS